MFYSKVFVLRIVIFLLGNISTSAYDDLSSGKAAFQSTTHECVKGLCAAGNAVDRNITTCMKTKPFGISSPDNTVWWYVDLGDIYSVYNIRIRFKDYGEKFVARQRGRFAGFSIFLSNTFKKEDGSRCYKDGPELPHLNFTTNCIGHGQYIIYYNERMTNVKYPDDYETLSYTELCEVIVKGCSEEFYGQSCDNNCPSNCKENRCDIIKGTCLGCKPGWVGRKCETPCQSGSYGPECKFQCSEHCKDSLTCNHISGACDDGCAPGWTGTLCNTQCSNRHYGQNCAFNCSGHCFNEDPCNRETGHCDSGCSPGYIDDFCNNVCTLGWFGKGCKQRCSGHCANELYCNHVDGVCRNGCRNGYFGQLCNTSCAPGHFGKNCSRNCSQTCNEICRHTDGSCLCKAGWMGSPMCDKECPKKKYGENCVRSCSPNCANGTCNRFNGSCSEGCNKPYYGEMCKQREGTSRLRSESESAKPLTIGAVIGAFAVVTILIVSIALSMRLRRKMHKGSSNASESTQLSMRKLNDQQSASAKKYSFKDVSNIKKNDSPEVVRVPDDIYETAKRGRPTNKTISVKNLHVIISKMSATENLGFKQEYHDIPKGELHACEEGKKPENKPKNRYTTTFPYDHSRVVLKSSSPNEGSYINANYIEDVHGKRTYIATQGPKPKTITDFWKMIWQEGVSIVVCLTNLKEGVKNKCALYWPDINDKIQNGDFSIRNLEEKQHANYTIRRFKVHKNKEKTTREVVMFHYTRWPDHGVPDPLSLVIFHRHVMKISSQNPGKFTVVHCSAGIGRTGTYIALDALYREGERNGKVNVPMYVRTMRKDRMNMIQGDDQYKAVYLALCESFNGKSRCLTTESFLREVQDQSCYANCGEVAKKSSLSSEFQELLCLRKDYEQKDYETGHMNLSANYTESVLPFDEFMCHLSYVKGRNSYYNAVLLQSFTKNDSLISAQYPLPDYTEDFLRLLKDFDVIVVVFLCPLKELKSSSLWLPSKNVDKTVGNFTIKLSASSNSANLSTRSIILQPKGLSDISITVLECKTWKEGIKMTDKRTLLDVAKEAKSEITNREGKVLILSSDGATRCGVFCVVYNALEQLTMDQEVDIFTITRQLQIRRPEFVSTLDEYQLCYDAVAEYIQNDSVYANC